MQADIFENNNTQAQATTLSLSFSGNNATKNTNGSNLHIGTDIDYYKITLPAGYDYKITPRLHDSYNSGNGQTYSVDGLFSYSTNGTTYSETYDDVMTGNITVNNGGTVYFKVAPYFSGNIGTYLLDLSLTRSLASGIEDIETNARILLYPNPAKGFVTLNLQEFTTNVNQVAVCNMQGKPVYIKHIDNFEQEHLFAFNKPYKRCLFVQIYSDKGIVTKKLIVKK
jgi:hypothetical protein